MLTVKDLAKEYRAADQPVKAVAGVSMSVPDGIFASIVGKSGSGKSTLLAMLGALDKPTAGSIEVDGEDITKMSDQKLIKYRRNKIGFVFQAYNLVPNLTALENVMLPLELAGVSRAERRERATHSDRGPVAPLGGFRTHYHYRRYPRPGNGAPNQSHVLLAGW
jgi:putative ABC transport system ATP-binding protein